MSLLTHIKLNPRPPLSIFPLSASERRRQGGERDSREWEGFLNDSKEGKFSHTQVLSPMDDVGFWCLEGATWKRTTTCSRLHVWLTDFNTPIWGFSRVKVFQFRLFENLWKTSEDCLVRLGGLSCAVTLRLFTQGCIASFIRMVQYENFTIYHFLLNR